MCQPIETLVEVEREVPILPTDRYEAARPAYLDSLRKGKQRIGRRPLMHRWGLEQREAEDIIAEVDKERAQADQPATPASAWSSGGAAGGASNPSSQEIGRLVARF